MTNATAGGPIRVLVVDDQAFMRMALRRIIEADGDMSVVGEGRDGNEAVAMARALRPDAITMDVEMPLLNGIDACWQIVNSVDPRPAIIMVSAYTQQGATETLEALRRGAVDFISKSSIFAQTDLAHIDGQLRPMLRGWARSDARLKPMRPTSKPIRVETNNGGAVATGAEAGVTSPRPNGPIDLIVIGSSTGGPHALTTLLRAIGPIAVPVVIAQHLPPYFTAGLAGLLAEDTGLVVLEATDGGVLQGPSVWLIPGGSDGTVVPGAGGPRLSLTASTGSVSPSADRLFTSAAAVARHPVAIVLTGMGRDGVEGARAFRKSGFTVLVQEPAECVVAGMPEATIDAGAASAVMSLNEIAVWLVRTAGQNRAEG